MSLNLKAPGADPGASRTAERDTAARTLAELRRAHCAEVADRGGRDISGQYPQDRRAVEMVDGTIWVQAPVAGGRWSDIHEFKGGARPGAGPDAVYGAAGSLLLPSQDDIDAHRAQADGPSRTRPGPHDPEFTAANTAGAARRALGEPPTLAERTAAIRTEADRRFGENWDQMPGPDHPDFRERERLVPWAARVPRYRYTLVGAVLGTVRVASIYVPLLGGAFRRWEDRLMYAVERHHVRTNRITEGGAYDPENGPNRDLLAEWRGRRAKVQEAIDNAAGEGFDMEHRLRHSAERNALAEQLVEALSHTPRMSAAMADHFARQVNPDAPAARPDWSAPDPLNPRGRSRPAPRRGRGETPGTPTAGRPVGRCAADGVGMARRAPAPPAGATLWPCTKQGVRENDRPRPRRGIDAADRRERCPNPDSGRRAGGVGGLSARRCRGGRRGRPAPGPPPRHLRARDRARSRPRLPGRGAPVDQRNPAGRAPELRALEEEIKALLIDPDTDWEALAVPGRALATDCPAAAPLPSAPQREADVAYRAAGAVLHDPHPAFALAGSWPVAVALEDNTRLLLRVVPAVLSFMPEWQAGRAVTLCFAWLDGVAQPLLLADMNRAVG